MRGMKTQAVTEAVGCGQGHWVLWGGKPFQSEGRSSGTKCRNTDTDEVRKTETKTETETDPGD